MRPPNTYALILRMPLYAPAWPVRVIGYDYDTNEHGTLWTSEVKAQTYPAVALQLALTGASSWVDSELRKLDLEQVLWQ